MAQTPPSVSLVICTRDRVQVGSALSAALSSRHVRFELILVDQSRTPVLSTLPPAVRNDVRFRYQHSSTRGLGRARNIGLHLARAGLVAFTDDDCTVPETWLSVIEHELARRPEVGMAFSNVEAGPHDPGRGFIPGYRRADTVVVRSLLGKCRARGIGAAMAVRRSAALDLGGFDERLGAGADFPSCEDGDMAVRLLLHGWYVLELGSVAVVHHGFRTWQEGKALARRNWIGVGAAYAKPLRRLRLSILPVIGSELWVTAGPPLRSLLRLRRPSGARDPLFLLEGLARGLRVPVDPRTLTFAPRQPASTREEAPELNALHAAPRAVRSERSDRTR